MSEVKETKKISEQASEGISSEGVRARRAFMLKFLIGGDGDWINKNIVAKGKGHSALVGRVFGVCTGAEEKTNTLPDGNLSKSIVLYGQFEYASLVTGEIGQSSSVYLPMAYAQQLAAVFASDPGVKMIEVDVDIGIEATGKTIPYEWLVVNHAQGEAALLTRLRSRRQPGQKALAAPAAAAVPAVEHKQAAPADAETGDAGDANPEPAKAASKKK